MPTALIKNFNIWIYEGRTLFFYQIKTLLNGVLTFTFLWVIIFSGISVYTGTLALLDYLRYFALVYRFLLLLPKPIGTFVWSIKLSKKHGTNWVRSLCGISISKSNIWCAYQISISADQIFVFGTIIWSADQGSQSISRILLFLYFSFKIKKIWRSKKFMKVVENHWQQSAFREITDWKKFTSLFP